MKLDTSQDTKATGDRNVGLHVSEWLNGLLVHGIKSYT